MTTQETINFVDIARMGYICDPHECGLEKGGDLCKAFHCDEIHDALAMAIEALKKQIPQKPIKKKFTFALTPHFERLQEFYACPVCGNRVEVEDNEGYATEHYPTCVCGQRIDWGEIIDIIEMKWIERWEDTK